MVELTAGNHQRQISGHPRGHLDNISTILIETTNTYVRSVKAGPHMGDQAGNVLVQERSTQESQHLTPGVVIQAPTDGVVEASGDLCKTDSYGYDSKPLTKKEKGSTKVPYVLASLLKLHHKVPQRLAARSGLQCRVNN